MNGDLIRNARLKKGLNQQALADIIKSTKSSISRYENGLRQLQPGMAKKIAQALDFDWTLIYQDEDINAHV